MRMGPGKHLKGLTLMGGIVKPEEFTYFHEVKNQVLAQFPLLTLSLQLVIQQEMVRCAARGYGDGAY